MLPRGGNGQTVDIPLRGHGAGDALHAAVNELRNPGLTVLRLAAAHGAEGGAHRIQQGVVPIEDQQPLRLQILQNLALGLENSLAAPQKLHMGVADVGDDGDVRPHHLPQVADLSEVVHARLNHRRLVLRGKAQQRQGRADVVVKVPRRLVDPQTGPQHRGDHLLGGGLPHAAGDLDEGNGEPVPVSGGQGPQGQTGVRHLDVEFIGTHRLRQAGAQAPRRAALQSLVNVVVSVKPRPRPGDKQAAGLNLPAVRGHRGDNGRVRPGILPHASRGGGDLLHGHGLHRLNLSSSSGGTAPRSPGTARGNPSPRRRRPWGSGCRGSCPAGSSPPGTRPGPPGPE